MVPLAVVDLDGALGNVGGAAPEGGAIEITVGAHIEPGREGVGIGPLAQNGTAG